MKLRPVFAPPGSGGGGAPAPAGPVVPFLAGTYHYSEPMFTDVVTPGANAQEFIHNITPGGFLRGVLLTVTSTGGVIGTGVVAADSPWSLFSSISIESIDGTPIVYPLAGYDAYLLQRYTRPWDSDPAQDAGANFSATINPAFRLRIFVESRMTLGVVPNTDARAQYRIRFTVASFNPGIVTTTGTATAPAVTIAGALEVYAQPPHNDLAGNPIAQIPDGMTVQRFLSRQANIPTVAGVMTIQSNRVGNLIRSLILVFRDSAGARIDLTADPIRLRLDSTQLLAENRNHRDYEMDRFFGSERVLATRQTGVYVYPRWHDPGAMDGPYWLPTTEASYLTYEISGGPAGGSLTILTEDLAPSGPIPAYLQGL